MNAQVRHFIHGVIFALGLILILLGIITRTHGAWIVGLIVSAVDFRQWRKWSRRESPD